jgi:hypothetical protein
VLDEEPDHGLEREGDSWGRTATAVGPSCPVSFPSLSSSSSSGGGSGSSSSSGSSGPMWYPGGPVLPRHCEFSPGQLDSIKAKLELLLPQGSVDIDGNGYWGSQAA